MRRFEGKTIVVTGAASGIGLATAERFVAEGARVYAGDVNSDALAENAARIGTSYVAVTLDVLSSDSIAALVAQLEATGGVVDCLVNNAGGTRPRSVKRISDSDLDFVIGINLRAPIKMIQAMLPFLEKAARPSVVNVCSISAKVQVVAGSLYGATKAGLESFTRTCAKEMPAIRFNAVLPAYTVTQMFTARYAEEELMTIAPVVGQIPAGRWARPEEVAGPIAFLASDDASYITGSSLVIDGGLSAAAPIGG